MQITINLPNDFVSFQSAFVYVLYNEQDYEQVVELLNSLLTGLERLWTIKNTTRYVFSDLLL